MTGNTHAAIGAATGMGMVYVTGADTWTDILISVGLACFAALLPDLDAENSKLQNVLIPKMSPKFRKAVFFAVAFLLILVHLMIPEMPFYVILIALFLFVAVALPHRSITHSALMIAYVGWTVNLISPEWMWVFVAGYASHLIADMLTVSGIPLFWPIKQKFSLSQIGIRIKTGTIVDRGVGYLAIGLLVLGIFYLFA